MSGITVAAVSNHGGGSDRADYFFFIISEVGAL